MTDRTFSHPYWCHRVFNYMPVLPLLILFLIVINYVTLICLLVPIVFLSYVYYYHGKISRKIEVDSKRIKGVAYNKSVAELDWEDISEMVEKNRFLISSFSIIELIGKDKKAKIIFLDKIKEFDELITLIKQRAVNLDKRLG